MLLNRNENAHQELMRKSIQSWISDPDARLLKATDANDQVIGWSCWITKEAQQSETTTGTESKPENETVREGAAPEELSKRKAEPPQDPARALGGLMFKDRVAWEEKYLKGKRYAVLQGLATDPLYQRRGIGTKLVQQGLEEIDAEGLPCWIHASPSSYKLYEKAGFQEVGRNDYDLDEWAPGGKNGNRGWGRYTFRHMLRPARTATI
ncbi:GNAT family [Colletotrichum truncatum]|uniref:GNAT family n=1 Tax=Colletotrichum truncatum TaxID=5467 RepID=A0ACC3YTA2_COLTU|nr:GNAT family [Colletotrichum truncatum]KAF6798316.1 GNAT family [Colletotrichum truncatum]